MFVGGFLAMGIPHKLFNMNCDTCKENVYEVRYEPEKDQWNCPNCRSFSAVDGVSFYARGTVHIEGYGNESTARIDELKRRVVVKNNPDGTYVLGRRGENGKIQDRQPNYYK